MKRKEKYTHLIDSLEKTLFPFQESEFEQESFTEQGRLRLDEWFTNFFSQLRKEWKQNPSKRTEEDDDYFTNFVDERF